MDKWYLAYPIVGAAFLILDMIWLRFAVPMLYRPALGDLLATNFRAGPAVAFYIIYFAALTVFAVLPGTMLGVPAAVASGAALGLTAYATYNLTNMATLKVWPLQMTLIDIAWGTVSSGLAAGIAVTVMLKLQG
ncbi:MAG: DUF2177 family protein [Sphingomonadales bacterium]|nr:DUF2177 family protein [Sphingomonadales bacterium]